MAKISISVPDELVEDLHALAPENVSAFVSLAIRHEIDRRALFAFLDELEDELGPVDEGEVEVFSAVFSTTGPVDASSGRSRRPAGRRTTRSRSAS